MRDLRQREIGVIFWAVEDPHESLSFVRQFGLHAGQLGFGGDLDLSTTAERWRTALEENADISLVTAVCSYTGEEYSDVGAVQRTVGFVPQDTRAERVIRTKTVADIAANLGIRDVACHIGFVPEEPGTRSYAEIRDVVREICDHLGEQGQQFALETGQESAPALLSFIGDVGRPNLKVNFDPANMVLYGTGDPVEAIRILAEHVVSVHCKDAEWPDKTKPGALGVERPLGTGVVDFPAFLTVLKQLNYQGILSIEREEPDAQQRIADIHHAVKFLKGLLGEYPQ